MSGQKLLGWRGLLLIAILTVAGCVQETEVNGELVYEYELWVSLSVVLAGVVATGIGWILRERSTRFGWGLVVVAPMLTLLFAPSLFRDRATVSEQGFQVRTGIWGLTAVHSLQFGDIKEIRIAAEKSYGRRGMRTNYYLICDKRSGGSSKVPINNAVCEAAAEAILEQADNRGIPIRDASGG